MKKIRIAQIGTGHAHAGAAFKSLRKQPDLFEIVGIAEPIPERAGKKQVLHRHRDGGIEHCIGVCAAHRQLCLAAV